MASVAFPDNENPHILPPQSTVIWHYMLYEYFQCLLKERALYLTRIDDQSDTTDGMYSSANATGITPVMKKLAEASGIIKMGTGADFFPTNSILRRKTYIHCWSMGANDSAWMWNEFLGNCVRSVAVRTTIGRLRAALASQPVDMARIIYYPASKPRPDWSYTAPFLAKDKHFERERELRLIHTLEIGAQTESDFKLIPLNVRAFLKIVIHPLCDTGFKQEVRNEVAKYKVHVAVKKSTLAAADLRPFQSVTKI